MTEITGKEKNNSKEAKFNPVYQEEYDELILELFDCYVNETVPDYSLYSRLADVFVTTDKLSVEKLQEQLNTAKKALTEIYLDENETIIDPVFLFHQSQRIAERALKELGENNEI